MENVYNWQFNTLPGNANQGAVLMTKNNITEPPFTQDDFVWKAMEDIIGVADMKLEYDEEKNEYSLYKAKGHRDNDGEWIYDYELVGTFHEITEAVQEALENLAYIEYEFDTTTVPNTLIVYGVKKDGTKEELARVSTGETLDYDFPIEIYRDASNNLKVKLNYDSDYFELKNNNTLTLKAELLKKMTYKGTRATTNDLPTTAAQGDTYYVTDEGDLFINISDTSTVNFIPFTLVNENFDTYAIELAKTSSGIYAKLNYDTVDFTIDAFRRLKSQIINDSIDASDPNATKKTYSVNKILELISSMFRYKGQVDYYDQLPTTGNRVGDSWNVKYEGPSSGGSLELNGDNYAWNGTGWDDLSGEYRAGAGIVINGKTISATGISFIVGDGLRATGAGSTTTLSARITNGIEFVNVGTAADPVNAVGVKKGSGVTVNANGVNVNTGNTTKTVNDNLEVDYANGLTQDSNNKLAAKINTTNLKFDNDGSMNTVLQTWTGTQAQYDAITTKDPNTLYMIHS